MRELPDDELIAYLADPPQMRPYPFDEPLFQRTVFVPYFDGLTQHAEFAKRAIDLDGDIVLEFWTPTQGGLKTIIYQGAGESSFNDCDCWLVRNGSNIEFRVGGVGAPLGALPSFEIFKLTLIGTSLVVKDSNDEVVRSMTFNRGTYRSTTPVTLIGARLSGSFKVNFYEGKMPGIKINGTKWQMNDRNNQIQKSIPTGNPLTIINHTPAMWRPL
ncbi:hypothetical protein ACQ9QQ_001198 [Vibrio cholerae]